MRSSTFNFLLASISLSSSRVQLSTLIVGCRCGCCCYAKASLFVIAFYDWFRGKNSTLYKERGVKNRAVLDDIPLETVIVGLDKMAAIENDRRRA